MRARDGLPVGLQIVGPRHADGRVLALAHAFQQCHRLAPGDRPPDVLVARAPQVASGSIGGRSFFDSDGSLGRAGRVR